MAGVQAIAAMPSVDPPLPLLLYHITELEGEVRNLEFRLQYFYYQRKSTLSLLGNARLQAKRLREAAK